MGTRAQRSRLCYKARAGLVSVQRFCWLRDLQREREAGGVSESERKKERTSKEAPFLVSVFGFVLKSNEGGLSLFS